MALEIDGAAVTSSGSKSSLSVSLSTTTPGDVVLVFAQISNNATATVSDSAGLTWTSRVATQSSSASWFEFYAIAPSVLSADTITLTLSEAAVISALAAVAVTTAPFDTNPSVPYSSVAWGATPSIATSGANDLVIVVQASAGGVRSALGDFPAGWTPVENTLGTYLYAASQTFTSPQSNVSPTFSVGGGHYGGIADALVASGGGPAAAYPFRRNRTYLGR